MSAVLFVNPLRASETTFGETSEGISFFLDGCNLASRSHGLWVTEG